MKRFFTIAAICFATSTANYANAQTGLGDVFGSGTPAADKVIPEKTESETETGIHIGEVCTEAGYMVKNSKSDFVEMTVKESGISYPVVVYKSESKEILWFQINLVKLPENMGEHAEKIKMLLNKNGSFGPCFYGVADNGMIQMLGTMRMPSVTPETVESQVEMMIAQLDEQIKLWDTSKWTVARHVGSWSSKLDAESAMVINLRGNGTFDLTNTSGSKTTSITGNYLIEAGSLKMKDSQGNEIAGNIVFIDGNHFDLDVNDKSLRFERG